MRVPSISSAEVVPLDREHARLFWLACFLGWGALVTVTASTLFVIDYFPFLFALQMAIALWGPYALAAPVVFWFARRVPIREGTWRRNLPLHALASVVFVVVCDGSFAASIHRLQPRAHALLLERQSRGEAFAGDGDPLFLPPEKFLKIPGASLRLILFKMQFSLPLYWVLVGVAHALGGMAALRERERRSAQLEAHLTQAQLAGLRTQLHPHFLFNTLNSITALIPQNAQLATEMVMNLSDLLRMTLRDPQRGAIPLSEELTLLRHYVDIQRLRFSEKLNCQVDASEDALSASVPPLILQPLVENAIRHGVEASDQCETITVFARMVGESLLLEVVNTFTSAAENYQPPAPSTGVGLANTKARLQVHYGDRQQFEAAKREEGGFRVMMRIPTVSTVSTGEKSLTTSHEDQDHPGR